MARSIGSRFRRYVGEKIYHAEIAARKATPLADNGHDIDVAPFWEGPAWSAQDFRNGIPKGFGEPVIEVEDFDMQDYNERFWADDLDEDFDWYGAKRQEKMDEDRGLILGCERR